MENPEGQGFGRPFGEHDEAGQQGAQGVEEEFAVHGVGARIDFHDPVWGKGGAGFIVSCGFLAVSCRLRVAGCRFGGDGRWRVVGESGRGGIIGGFGGFGLTVGRRVLAEPEDDGLAQASGLGVFRVTVWVVFRKSVRLMEGCRSGFDIAKRQEQRARQVSGLLQGLGETVKKAVVSRARGWE